MPTDHPSGSRLNDAAADITVTIIEPSEPLQLKFNEGLRALITIVNSAPDTGAFASCPFNISLHSTTHVVYQYGYTYTIMS